MSDRVLEAPDDPDRLYEYLPGDDPPPLSRPLAQGDVLNSALDGGTALVMVVAHPCSMRKGGRLRDRLAVAEISEHQRVPTPKWPTGYFDVLPLPGLVATGRDRPVAVHFHHLSTVDASALALDRRVAVLSEYGQTVLLQRWIYHMARYVVLPGELGPLLAPVQAEISLQQDWVEAAIAGRDSTDLASEAVAMQEAAQGFQDFLGAPDDPASLRNLLGQGHPGLVDVRKRVRLEMARRFVDSG